MKNKSTLEKNIGLFGVFGNGNLGCASSKYAIINNLMKRNKNIRIYGFSANPYITEKTHGIKCFPITKSRKNSNIKKGNYYSKHLSDNNISYKIMFMNWIKKKFIILMLARIMIKALSLFRDFVEELRFLIENYRKLKHFDMIMVAGGGQLGDMWGSSIFGHSYTILKWAFLCKLSKTKFIIFNAGANSIKLKITRYITYLYIKFSSYVSFRDRSSKEILKDIVDLSDGVVSIDAAYSLEIKEKRYKTQNIDVKNNLVIGINPVAYCDPTSWYRKDKEIYNKYVNNMISIITWLIISGHYVVLIPSQIRMDRKIVNDIMQGLNKDDYRNLKHNIDLPQIRNVDEIISTIDKVDIVIACRYHGIILSHLLGKPVLAIGYHQKSNDLITEVTGNEYYIDIDKLDIDTFKVKFNLMVMNYSELTEKIIYKVQAFKKKLALQYDFLIEKIVFSNDCQ